MVDHLTPKRRSENMAAIKGRDTTPELIVRKMLHRAGYRYRLHRRDLPGRPDIVFPGRKAVIFVHGCFWHQHKSSKCKARPPKSNRSYWVPKLKHNVERDQKNRKELVDAGWRVFVVWECETKHPDELMQSLRKFLDAAQ